MSTVHRTYTAVELRAAIGRLPRERFAHIPTPLQEAPRFAAALGGPRIWLKRDDLTGMAFGGNKTRNLEFRLAEAKAAGADTLVFGVEITSNSARQTTAAGNMLGFQTVLVLRGKPPAVPQGNLLVDLLLGAEVIFMEGSNAEMEAMLEEICARLRREGKKPFNLNTAPMFAVASACAYVESLLEVLDQSPEPPTHVYMVSGSKGQAGLALAKKAMGLTITMQGIAVNAARYDRGEETARIANDAATKLGLGVAVAPSDIENENYMGEGYGIPSPEAIEAIKLLARTEGVLLDPVYSGKGMAGLIDHVRQGRLGREDRVVFIHTGGQPALFSFPELLLQ